MQYSPACLHCITSDDADSLRVRWRIDDRPDSNDGPQNPIAQ